MELILSAEPVPPPFPDIGPTSALIPQTRTLRTGFHWSRNPCFYLSPRPILIPTLPFSLTISLPPSLVLQPPPQATDLSYHSRLRDSRGAPARADRRPRVSFSAPTNKRVGFLCLVSALPGFSLVHGDANPTLPYPPGSLSMNTFLAAQ